MPPRTPPNRRPPAGSGNLLLDRLPAATSAALRPHLQAIPLELRLVLHEPLTPVEHVYFPTRGAVSTLALMEDGTGIEVGITGTEGVVGLPALLGVGRTPARSLVQLPGEALRVRAAVLRDEMERHAALRQVLLRSAGAFHGQLALVAACNGLHSVGQRICRWLLTTQDHAAADEFPVTHEFLAFMLGVRRSSVSEVARPLQQAGCIDYRRGRLRVLDRRGLECGACECYRRIREIHRDALA
ncbi:MAG TPA: Crp/Fnr family transcriptional regulator [Gemmataceae bacterium]|nr:Crp/Fnr family transcriptional regulator [Gemmataceae bacterium]